MIGHRMVFLVVLSLLSLIQAAPTQLVDRDTTNMTDSAGLPTANSSRNNSMHEVLPNTSALIAECNHDAFLWGQFAITKYIRIGWNYLQDLDNDCVVKARDEQRLSCSWGNGIYVLNKNDEELRVPCKLIGVQTEKLAKLCLAHVKKDVSFAAQGYYEDGNYEITIRAEMWYDWAC